MVTAQSENEIMYRFWLLKTNYSNGNFPTQNLFCNPKKSFKELRENKLLKIWRKYKTGESMKNYLQAFLWTNSFKLDKQRPIIAYFKDLGMRNLQYDIRIWRKITIKSQWHIMFGNLFYESEFTTANVQTRVCTGSKNAKKCKVICESSLTVLQAYFDLTIMKFHQYHFIFIKSIIMDLKSLYIC